MKNNKDILASILKTSQMGQVGIRAVLPYAVKQEMKQALSSQRDEYASIEKEAHAIAAARGWELNELDPVAKIMSKACAKGNLMLGRSDSKIAAMMINGNTRGMIKGLKNLHHCPHTDHAIAALGQKLLDRESDNIRQMHNYV
jgi:hypothetical protein